MADVLSDSPLASQSLLKPALPQNATVQAQAVVPSPAPAATPAVTGADQFLERNKQWVNPNAPTSYNTELAPHEELAFRQWVAANNVPFDPNAPISDYDMRGFYKALTSGDEKAKSAIDPNDDRIHYPDYWKTPYHESFSNESQWADPKKAPSWNDKDQLVMPDGTVVYDDRAPKKKEQ